MKLIKEHKRLQKLAGILKEYIVRSGSSMEDILAINLFLDLDNEGGSPLTDFEGYQNDKRWQGVVDKYTPEMERLKAAIMSRANEEIPEEFVDEIDSSWYDGSDAYDDVESSIIYLPEIYDNQIEILNRMLN